MLIMYESPVRESPVSYRLLMPKTKQDGISDKNSTCAAFTTEVYSNSSVMELGWRQLMFETDSLICIRFVTTFMRVKCQL